MASRGWSADVAQLSQVLRDGPYLATGRVVLLEIGPIALPNRVGQA